jgi:Tol biopolymer transport system component
VSDRIFRSAPALALALLAACAGDQLPTEAGSLSPARGGNAATLVATPGALALVLPSAASGTITASVQFTGLITATTSDAACAVASPLNAPAMKPAGSSVYVATFTVTGAGPGSCTITLTDKRGGTATVQVQVREAPPVDGTKLVFSSNRDGNYELYSSNGDGSGLVRLTTTAANERDPAFFPDRSKVVYASDETGPWNLFMANADGSSRIQLTFYDLDPAFGAVSPAVSPDGQHIAFVLYPGFGGGNGVQIYVMDAEAGATPVAITTGNTYNLDPAYAPDGRIVFSSVPFDPGPPVTSGYPSIWIMFGNGASPTRLTNVNDVGDGTPAVSPDGTTIAFSRSGSIALMDIDGQNQRVVVTGASSGFPVFSPDGAWLAFLRSQGTNSEVMVLKLGQPESEALNVTNNPAGDGSADWR